MDTELLWSLYADAGYLKNHRKNGKAYFEKCAEVLERIKSTLNQVEVEKLSDDQVSIINSINKIIASEEQFARSSFETRSPDGWKDFLND